MVLFAGYRLPPLGLVWFGFGFLCLFIWVWFSLFVYLVFVFRCLLMRLFARVSLGPLLRVSAARLYGRSLGLGARRVARRLRLLADARRGRGQCSEYPMGVLRVPM